MGFQDIIPLLHLGNRLQAGRLKLQKVLASDSCGQDTGQLLSCCLTDLDGDAVMFFF